MRRTAVSCAKSSRLIKGREIQMKRLDRSFKRKLEGIKKEPRIKGHERLGLAEVLGESSRRRRTYAF